MRQQIRDLQKNKQPTEERRVNAIKKEFKLKLDEVETKDKQLTRKVVRTHNDLNVNREIIDKMLEKKYE